MILFNAYDFVITTYKRPIDDSQGCAHIFEDTIEPTAGINNKICNHAKQENNIIHEKFLEMFRMRLRSYSRDNKMRYFTHSVQ